MSARQKTAMSTLAVPAGYTSFFAALERPPSTAHTALYQRRIWQIMLLYEFSQEQYKVMLSAQPAMLTSARACKCMDCLH